MRARRKVDWGVSARLSICADVSGRDHVRRWHWRSSGVLLGLEHWIPTRLGGQCPFLHQQPLPRPQLQCGRGVLLCPQTSGRASASVGPLGALHGLCRMVCLERTRREASGRNALWRQ